MANDNHLFSVTCYNVTMINNKYYNDFFELGQQKIDGTKIEANANRYTFVWRGSINYHLARLLDTIDSLYQRYNAFLNENGYGSKYGIGNAQNFTGYSYFDSDS